MKISGAEAIIQSLLKEKVKVIFGYPGGANMPIYDALYKYRYKLRHVLVRHEQGAVHAAEGYARITGKPGVCFATSGPGATNLVTGIADAMMDSVPLVCITGQVPSSVIGTDAFQETDVIGITTPITKWNFQITKAEEIPEVFAKAFYIASHGRPGPVVIDITKNAQFEELEFRYPNDFFIEKIKNVNKFKKEDLEKAAEIINKSKRPLIIVGHGALIAKVEKEVLKLVEKTGIPIAVTLHGLSVIPFNHHLYVGMVGMHGNYAPNKLTNEADVILAIGLRFDDRVTGRLSDYAKKAKIIHIDIDESEHGKNVKTTVSLIGDAKDVLKAFLPLLKKNNYKYWVEEFKKLYQIERQSLEERKSRLITMKEVIEKLSLKTKNEAVIVADVGQNQMMAARYYKYKNPNSYITSGGLGTMGFALPASIGVKIGMPKKQVFVVVGDGGFQMTLQELGTIMQENLPIKILLFNNEYLGMVRQWQELFFEKRYSFTYLKNPDFINLVKSYGIKAKRVDKREDLDEALDDFIKSKEAYLIEIKVIKEENVFPMIPAGSSVDEIRLK